MTSQYPFKNLVFEGGGVKGLAYLGALEVMGEHNIVPQIERVAGASAGAVMATVLSFRHGVQETIDLFNSLDFSQMLTSAHERFTRMPQRMKKDIDKPLTHLQAVQRLNKNFGLYTHTYFRQWMSEIITARCDGNSMATFADFKERSFRDLYVITTNLSQNRSQVFSFETTPQAPVIDAVQMSMSIPLFFEAIQFDGEHIGQGDWYVDGGLFNNFPITTFDQRRYADEKSLFDGEINWETLGCHLHANEKCEGSKNPITDVSSYFKNLLDSLLAIQKVRFEDNPFQKLRTIDIDDCCVSATDFSVNPASDKYNELAESGRAAARDFLKDYQLPDLNI